MNGLSTSSPKGLPKPKSRAKSNSRQAKRLLCMFIAIALIWCCLTVFLTFAMHRMSNENKLSQRSHKSVTAFVAAREKRKREIDGLPAFPINHRSVDAGRRLSDQAISQCHKALWHALETTTFVLPKNETFVISGDIKNLWLRDSAAQMHPLLIPNVYQGKSLVQIDPKLERVVSGLILKTARFIRFDPYSNSFHREPENPKNAFDREALGRHGYIATRNYELDSGCYFIRMLYYFQKNFPAHPLLREREVKEAVMIMVDVWIAEQRHEEDAYPKGELFDCKHCGKPYRYNPKELERNGKGTKTNSTAGLTWSGFRPGDNPCSYAYVIPSNMFAVVVLGYVMEMATTLWTDDSLMKKAQKLRQEIDDGIRRHGIVEHKTYGKIYAYEVDGLGHSLLEDDANVPSLLSIPYLGYKYDERVYANTKRFILSKDNPYFYQGKSGGIEYSGIGSKRTNANAATLWPMAMIMEGLVSKDASDKVILVEKLVASSAGTGYMHGSFKPTNPRNFLRPWFCWADALFAELVMSLTEGCPMPERGKYAIKEWDEYGDFVNGSAFEKPPPPSLVHSTLAVMSACIPGQRFNDEYINESLENKQSFCDKWNATCLLSREAHDTSNPEYHAKWEKLYLIDRALHTVKSDWLMWLDCDAAFTNFNIDWRKHLRGHLDSSKVLITSKDKNGINLGVIFIPNTPTAHVFIDLLYETRHWVEKNPNKKEWKDQAALNELLANQLKWKDLVDDTMPQQKINSYFDNPDGHKWKENEWIAHQVWCQKPRKCSSHFLSVLDKVKQSTKDSQ